MKEKEVLKEFLKIILISTKLFSHIGRSEDSRVKEIFCWWKNILCPLFP